MLCRARVAPGNVITYTCFIYGHTAQVLLDIKASHSFIASNYVDEYELVTTSFHEIVLRPHQLVHLFHMSKLC